MEHSDQSSTSGALGWQIHGIKRPYKETHPMEKNVDEFGRIMDS